EVAGAHRLPIELAITARVTALIVLGRMLDLDHVGAEQRELIRREGSCEDVGDVDDDDALERSHRLLTSRARLPCAPPHHQTADDGGMTRAPVSPAISIAAARASPPCAP